MVFDEMLQRENREKGLPYSCQGMRQREQCAMSNARGGYGNRLDASTPIIAGTPRSSANCTCASCESLGANDIVSTSLDNRNKLGDVVDVGVGAAGEHRAAAGEPELIAVDSDPVLHGLLDAEFLVRDVSEPGRAAAGGPWERISVADRRRYQTLQNLIFGRTVAFSIDETVPVELETPVTVLAGSVLAVLGITSREILRLRRGQGGVISRVVGGEV
ncbi:hypothetical protein DsansV1_C32g0223271 [Dioscorea sansibarensis]